MKNISSFASEYDVIIVGARAAGAGTALLLGRAGLRVLMVDRGRYGSDTLSTHALMRGGVLQLARWGVLPSVQDAGTPPVRRATFVYEGEALSVPIKSRGGVDALYAPRRTVLDPILVDAAAAAGVDVAYGTALLNILRESDGRVSGVVLRGEWGRTERVMSRMVVGADGLRSLFGGLVNAATTRAGTAAAATVFGYWAGIGVDEYRWYYSPGLSAGAIPTNEGLTCIFASVPANGFSDRFGGDVAGGYRRVLAEVAADLTAPMANGRLVGHLHGFPGHAGFLRRATGRGWALVGDAAYFKDPLTAHGITDALIEAEYLARAIATGSDAALDAYADDRDRRAATIFEVTDRIASFGWSMDEARALHKRLAEAMALEAKALDTLALEGAPA